MTGYRQSGFFLADNRPFCDDQHIGRSAGRLGSGHIAARTANEHKSQVPT
jgi:hypothetical protein